MIRNLAIIRPLTPISYERSMLHRSPLTVLRFLLAAILIFPSTGRAEARPPAAESVAAHIIEAGETLDVSVSPADELSKHATVDQTGRISYPLIGAIQASGLTAEQLADVIRERLSKYVS